MVRPPLANPILGTRNQELSYPFSGSVAQCDAAAPTAIVSKRALVPLRMAGSTASSGSSGGLRVKLAAADEDENPGARRPTYNDGFSGIQHLGPICPPRRIRLCERRELAACCDRQSEESYTEKREARRLRSRGSGTTR